MIGSAPNKKSFCLQLVAFYRMFDEILWHLTA